MRKVSAIWKYDQTSTRLCANARTLWCAMFSDHRAAAVESLVSLLK